MALAGMAPLRRSASFPSRKENHGGDASNVEARGHVGQRLGVDLGDDHLPGALGGDFLQFRRHHATRGTPFGPEIDEDRPRRIANEFVEILGAGDGDGVDGRQERGFANRTFGFVTGAPGGKTVGAGAR